MNSRNNNLHPGGFTFFLAMWGIAHIGHFLRKGDALDPFVWILFLFAVLLVFHPQSRKIMIALTSFQIFYLFREMPFTDNHLYIMGFVNAGLLFTAIRSFKSDQSYIEFAEQSASYICAALLIAYFSAAFAKFNSGFFDPEYSCAVSMFYDSASVITKTAFLPYFMESILPYSIAAIELSIPVLLLVKKTRHTGIILLILFHLAISISPTATALDFTVMLFAFSVLFLDDRALRELIKSVGLLRDFAIQTIISKKYIVPGIIISLLIFLKVVSRVTMVSHNLYWFLLAPFALLFGGLIILSIVKTGIFRKSVKSENLFSSLNFTYSALLVLLFLNVITPYLGIKTTGTFTMYSNLQTENGRSNHFIAGRVPFDMPMDDLVRIEKSNHPHLARFSEKNERITYHEFERIVSGRRDINVTYIRGGARISYNSSVADKESITIHPVYHKLIGHRSYTPGEPVCRW